MPTRFNTCALIQEVDQDQSYYLSESSSIESFRSEDHSKSEVAEEYEDETDSIAIESQCVNLKAIQDVYGPVIAKIKKGVSFKIPKPKPKPSKMYYPNLKNPKNCLDFEAIKYEKSRIPINQNKE